MTGIKLALGSGALAVTAIIYEANGPAQAFYVAVFFLTCAMVGDVLQRCT